MLVSKKSREGSRIWQYINLLTNPKHNKQVAGFKWAFEIQQEHKTQEKVLHLGRLLW